MSGGLGGLCGEETGVDLAHRDGERLLLRSRLDERADVLEQALAELAVVGVDLTGALGREDHQRVLGGALLEQLVDRRVGDAFGVGDGSGHGESNLNHCAGFVGESQWSGWLVYSREPSNPTSSSAA